MTTSDDASGHADAYWRWRASGEVSSPVVRDGDHLGWLWVRARNDGEEVWATVLGDDADVVVRISGALAEIRAIDGITVRAGVYDSLPDWLRAPEMGDWCNWTLDPMLVELSSDDEVVELSKGDPRIDGLLAHSESAYVRSDDPSVAHWMGIERGDDLVAVGASVREPSGAAHLVSICTRTDLRGGRLAERVCGGLMRAARDDGAPIIYLEMYSANQAGRRLYQRLGFTEVGRYRSGLLPKPDASSGVAVSGPEI